MRNTMIGPQMEPELEVVHAQAIDRSFELVETSERGALTFFVGFAGRLVGLVLILRPLVSDGPVPPDGTLIYTTTL